MTDSIDWSSMYEEFDANVFNPCPDDRRTIRTASTALEIVLGLVR